MIDSIQIQFAAITHVGLKRPHNEDSLMVEQADKSNPIPKSRGMFFAIADGMGGHSCGEIASQMACQGLCDALNSVDHKAGAYRRRLENRFFVIDDRIRAHAIQDPTCAHMGTTLTALAINSDFVVTAHVGDSRIYRLRNGRLSLLTTDHTFVQEMIDEGELTPERASSHPFRNMLTHVMGTEESLEKVDTSILKPKAGDQFLISSDGLHNLVKMNEIETTLLETANPKMASRQLLANALERGGSDNVTIIAVRLTTEIGIPRK